MPTPTKDQIIQVEQACLRLVVRAIRDYYKQAVKIFKEETDVVGDIAEDVTREALDTLGVSRKDLRLYNPSATDTIWNVGPHADGDRGEDFRVRLNFALLKAKSAWRVVEITA